MEEEEYELDYNGWHKSYENMVAEAEFIFESAREEAQLKYLEKKEKQNNGK